MECVLIRQSLFVWINCSADLGVVNCNTLLQKRHNIFE